MLSKNSIVQYGVRMVNWASAGQLGNSPLVLFVLLVREHAYSVQNKMVGRPNYDNLPDEVAVATAT